jgi:putative chitinase
MTPEVLARCTGSNLDRAQNLADPISSAMAAYDISTPERQAMFLANVGHESGGLRWLIEIWGPTEAQKRYEGRADLGNNQMGDGFRFRGRGLLQTTGRANYAKLTQRLRDRMPDVPDFTVSPELLAAPKWAAMSAADYWGMRKLNELADRGAFVDVVKKINGGINGLEDRMRLWNAAKAVL